MKVADFALRDRRKWVNRVEPGIQCYVLEKMVGASCVESLGIFDGIGSLDEGGAFRDCSDISRAEIVHVNIEIAERDFTSVHYACISKRSERLEQEVASVEAGSRNDTI